MEILELDVAIKFCDQKIQECSIPLIHALTHPNGFYDVKLIESEKYKEQKEIQDFWINKKQEFKLMLQDRVLSIKFSLLNPESMKQK